MKTTLSILTLSTLLLCGCVTCREHPTACKAVVAVVITGAVISVDHRRANHEVPMQQIPTTPNCPVDPTPCH